jgi:hypothetical protein
MHGPTLSKLIVLAMITAIGVFAWRKLTTIPQPSEAGEGAGPRRLAAAQPPAKDTPAGPVAEPQPSPAAAASAAPGASTVVDHGPFDALLAEFVRGGRVDYAGLQGKARDLDAYLQALAGVRKDALGRDERLALYINAYNAATLRLILDHPGIRSIMDIPEERRWKEARWTVAGERLSLDDIEHAILRKQFNEPRLHFAIVCASKGCPPLRSEAYAGQRVGEQLEDQARRVHQDPYYLRWDEAGRTLHLTRLYEWFKEDFAPGERSLTEAVAPWCAPAVAESLRSDPAGVRIQFLEWDWSLNTP